MTANPFAFSDDRCIQQLRVATVKDTLSGSYTAFYVDMPYIVVQVKNEGDARKMLIDVFWLTLKYYKR